MEMGAGRLRGSARSGWLDNKERGGSDWPGGPWDAGKRELDRTPGETEPGRNARKAQRGVTREMHGP